MTEPFVRSPASSANLGAGFDVLGMALTLYADCGLGAAPRGAQQLDEHHPGRLAFDKLGGTGPMWMRCNIPMARGLGFSGAARVAAATLAVAQRSEWDAAAVTAGAVEVLVATTELEGHGDNVAASLFGGVTAYVDGLVVSATVGPIMASAAFVAWVPDVTTSTEKSRQALGESVSRADAIHNIGRAIQLVAAFEHDDPAQLAGATADRLHQAQRLPSVPGASDALAAGVAAGAWAGWLSGSGPTVGFMCGASVAAEVAASLPEGGHTKILAIDTLGTRFERAAAD